MPSNDIHSAAVELVHHVSDEFDDVVLCSVHYDNHVSADGADFDKLAAACREYLDVYERAEHDRDSTPNGWTHRQRADHEWYHDIARFEGAFDLLDAFHAEHGCDRPSG